MDKGGERRMRHQGEDVLVVGEDVLVAEEDVLVEGKDVGEPKKEV